MQQLTTPYNVLAVAHRSGDVYGINHYSNQAVGVLNPRLTKVIGQFGVNKSLAVGNGIAVDDAGQVFIGTSGSTGGPPYNVEVFSAAARGSDPAPIRIITGPNIGLSGPGPITLIECRPHRGRP